MNIEDNPNETLGAFLQACMDFHAANRACIDNQDPGQKDLLLEDVNYLKETAYVIAETLMYEVGKGNLPTVDLKTTFEIKD